MHVISCLISALREGDNDATLSKSKSQVTECLSGESFIHVYSVLVDFYCLKSLRLVVRKSIANRAALKKE